MTAQVKWIVGISVLVTSVFCASFVLLYTRSQEKSALSEFPSTIEGRDFPAGRFTNLSGATLDDRLLRTGKVIIVFVSPECDVCDSESQFLRPLVNSRRDVKFYGIIPIGNRESALTAASQPNRYPFEVYYDDDFVYQRASSAIKIPIKIFLENGIVKRTWEGAARDGSEKIAFSKWLEDLTK